MTITDSYGRIAIIGAGDLGCQIAHMALQSNYNIVGFFDDFFNQSVVLNGISLLGRIDEIISRQDEYDSIVIAIGYKHFAVRASLYQFLKEHHIPLATIIHHTAYIDDTACIGEGSVISANVTIDKNCVVGNNVFINISSTIAHDSTIGDHSFLAPCVAVAGVTQIGRCSFIGINATIINRLRLPDNIVVGAGAVVTNNLNGTGTYVGIPARKIKD